MNKDIVNIVVGDSIAYGLYDDVHFGWVNRLKLKDKSMLRSFYFNLSIPGQNSSDILKRFKQEMKNRYNTNDIFNIIFAMGIKDALKLKEDPNYIYCFKQNIIKLIDISKKFTSNIFFLGLLNVDLNIRTEYDLKDIAKINDELRKICKDNKLLFIDMEDIVDINDFVDGLHPNSVGHQKICDIVYDKIYCLD